MGYNFPNSPAVNQTFTPSGGPTFQWNGVAWNAVTQGMPVTVYMSDTAPVSPAPGQLWWNSTTGNLSVFYADADSTQWVQVSGNLSSTAPNDGGEYVMCNGVWRLKSQRFNMLNKATQDVQVPAWGPSQLRCTFSLYCATTTYPYVRVSTDGTTFPSASGDYYFGGSYHYGTPPTFGHSVWGPQAALLIADGIGNAGIPGTGEFILDLTRTSAGQYFNGITYSNVYGPSGLFTYWESILCVNFPGTANIKTIRLFNSTAAVFSSGGFAVEWLP